MCLSVSCQVCCCKCFNIDHYSSQQLCAQALMKQSYSDFLMKHCEDSPPSVIIRMEVQLQHSDPLME